MILAVKPSPENNNTYVAIPVDDTNEKSIGIVVTPSKKSWRRVSERKGLFSTNYRWYDVGEEGIDCIGVVVGVFDSTNDFHVAKMNLWLINDPVLSEAKGK